MGYYLSKKLYRVVKGVSITNHEPFFSSNYESCAFYGISRITYFRHMTSQKTIIANLIFVHINFSDFFSIKGNYFSDATGATGTSSEETSQKM